MITKIIIISLLTITILVNNVSTNVQAQQAHSTYLYSPTKGLKHPQPQLNHNRHNTPRHQSPVADDELISSHTNNIHSHNDHHQVPRQTQTPLISRTHIGWRRQSSLDGDLNNEYYVEDHEAIPIVAATAEDELTYHQHAQLYQQPQNRYHPDEYAQQAYHQPHQPDDSHRAQPETAQQHQLHHHPHQQLQAQHQPYVHHQHHHDQADRQNLHLYQQQHHQQQQQPHTDQQAQHYYQPYYQPEQPQLPRHQRVVYSRLVNEDHIYESFDYFQSNRPLDSCGSKDYDRPHILMPHQPLDELTCRATSTSAQQQQHSYNGGGVNSKTTTTTTTADSSERVPRTFSHMNARHNSNTFDSHPLGPPLYPYESSLMAAIRHYWREVSGLCLASAIFLNWLFVAVKRRFISHNLDHAEQALRSIQQQQLLLQQQQQQQLQYDPAPNTNITKGSVSRDTNSYSAHDSAFEETNLPPLSVEAEDLSREQSSSSNEFNHHHNKKLIFDNIAQANDAAAAVMRQRSSTLKGEPMPIPQHNQSLTPNHHRSLSTSLSNSLNTSEYNSRYSSDFDSIQRLGRGGFGVVFEAKNKIDDCHYAVKRICLPLEKEARERVMREVRALAKLDHAGIVRYYNAWLETPPDNWLEQHDAQLGILHSKDGISFPSTDGLYDRNESGPATGAKFCAGDSSSSCLYNNNHQTKFRRRTPNGYSNLLKDNSNSPLLDIVFEGSGSIRVESENVSDEQQRNKLEKGNASRVSDDSGHGNKNKSSLLQRGNHNQGDSNISDSEDSDFIQFESRDRDNNNTNGGLISDASVSSHLTDPFSSTSSSDNNCGDDEEQEDSFSKRMQDDDAFVFATRRVDEARKRASACKKEMKQSLSENLHVEKVYLYIQMQLCRKDTLKDWLKTNSEARDKTTIFDLFYQIVDAVEYVHSQDLIHRDLKPSNIFFSLDGTLKIGDFGLCRAKTNVGVGSSLDLQEYFGESDIERGIEAVHTEQVGTQLYMSPEQLNGLGYNQKVDIFAMGLILIELLIPFKTQMQRVNVLFKARNNVYTNEFKEEYPKEHELVKSLLSRNPQKRPTASEIKQHELLASAQLSQPVIERIYHRRRTISSNSSTE